MNNLSDGQKAVRQGGFTLVEVIFVVIILGIVSSIGSGFVLLSLDAYHTAQARSQLVQRGRLAIEQMARQLRGALPGSVRISASGNCVEFLPIVVGANYQGRVPDENNGKAATSEVKTSQFVLQQGDARHVAVAPFFDTEIYTTSSPASRVAVGDLGSPPFSAIPLATSHQFIRNSVSRRIYLTDDPLRFCVANGMLVNHRNYGFLTAPIDDGAPGGQADIMAHDVSLQGKAFALSPGSEDRNTAVFIRLIFTRGSSSVALDHQVLIRNVP